MQIDAVFSADNRFKSIFRAFRYRNYRLFFSGQCISLIGTWIQQVAMSWLIYKLTQSPFLLGIVGFVSMLPSFLFSPFAGVLIDRFNKHKVIIITQIAFMIDALIVAILTLTGIIQVWHIIILGIVIGITNSFDMPARQAFVVQMVEGHEDLGNAIALNSSLFNMARLVGPAIAGALIATFGEGVCFLINSISYIPVIIALLAMKITYTDLSNKSVNVIEQLKEGVSYAFNFLPIRNIILYLALVSFMGMPYMVLMPIFAKEILHGNASMLGFLMSASGIGALVGALYLASRKSIKGLFKWIVIASALFGISLMSFAFSRNFIVAVTILPITGFGMIVTTASINTMLQSLVDEDKRGRIMSLYAMAFMGMAPFGSLFGGLVADKIGVTFTIFLSGLFIIIANIIFYSQLPLLRKYARPIFIKKHLITK